MFNVGLLAGTCGRFLGEGGLFSVAAVAVGTAENARGGGGCAFSAVSTAVLASDPAGGEYEHRNPERKTTTERTENTGVRIPKQRQTPTDSVGDPNVECSMMNVEWRVVPVSIQHSTFNIQHWLLTLHHAHHFPRQRNKHRRPRHRMLLLHLHFHRSSQQTPPPIRED